ncbi:unnamed protein product [marine sediment metagenome]|uniref:Alanine--tRNA ligase n=1 Tax=marine sediment metagenome TaxID=412755 RepID=X0VDI1_9ZZZZ
MLAASAAGGKIMLVAMVSEALVKQGRARADEWVTVCSDVVGGSGGGKPTMAQAGGKDAQKLPQALETAEAWIREKLALPKQGDP